MLVLLSVSDKVVEFLNLQTKYLTENSKVQEFVVLLFWQFESDIHKLSPPVFPPLPVFAPQLFLSLPLRLDYLLTSNHICPPPLSLWFKTAPLAVLQEDEFIIIIITMLIPEPYLPK